MFRVAQVFTEYTSRERNLSWDIGNKMRERERDRRSNHENDRELKEASKEAWNFPADVDGEETRLIEEDYDPDVYSGM